MIAIALRNGDIQVFHEDTLNRGSDLLQELSEREYSPLAVVDEATGRTWVATYRPLEPEKFGSVSEQLITLQYLLACKMPNPPDLHFEDWITIELPSVSSSMRRF